MAHNTFEDKCTDNVFDLEAGNKEQYLFSVETPFKTGKIRHLNIDWFSIGELDELRDNVHQILENLSKGVSGKPRKYIDNTLEVYKKYLEQNGKKE